MALKASEASKRFINPCNAARYDNQCENSLANPIFSFKKKTIRYNYTFKSI